MFECVILNIHSNKKTPYTVRKVIAGVYGFPFQNADTALHFHQEVRYGTQNLQKLWWTAADVIGAGRWLIHNTHPNMYKGLAQKWKRASLIITTEKILFFEKPSNAKQRVSLLSVFLC